MSRSTNHQRRWRLGRSRDSILVDQKQIEHLINETPTGDLRNKLTEANMHLMLADQAMLDALKMGESTDGVQSQSA